MTRYYIVDNKSERGYTEILEEEFNALRGTDETRPYIDKVYASEMMLDAVPAELQEAVNTSVEVRIARYGQYTESELSAQEAMDIILGGADE